MLTGALLILAPLFLALHLPLSVDGPFSAKSKRDTWSNWQ